MTDTSVVTNQSGPAAHASPEPSAARRIDRTQVAEMLAGPGRVIPLLVALACIWAFFATQSPVFLTGRNLTNLSSQIAVTAVLALGTVFILLVRQIDLSMAAVAAVSGAIAANLLVLQGWPLSLSIIIALIAGAVVAGVHAGISTLFAAPAFIVTLGGYFVLGAVLLWLIPETSVIPLANTPLEKVAGTYLSTAQSVALAVVLLTVYALLTVSSHRERVARGLSSSMLTAVALPVGASAAIVAVLLGTVFLPYRGVPLPVALLVVFTLILAYVSTNTAFGRHVYAVGGNPEAARRAGVSVGGVTIAAFMIGGLLSAAAGIMSASRNLGVSTDSSDLTLLLEALAAVIIGGVSLFGGRGSVWSAILGSLVIGSISNGLYLINASTEIRWTITGCVLIVAVLLDSFIVKQGSRA